MPYAMMDGSLGAAKESTFGVAVTPSKFVEYLPDSSFKWSPTFNQGQGLRAGSQFARSARRPKAPGRQMVSADLNVEACSKGIGWIIAAALGTVSSTQRASTGVYQHNFTPKVADYLDSYTFQHGRPILGGSSIAAHTLSGMVCSKIEFDMPNGEIMTIKTSWVGKDIATGTAYTSPSYPTPIEVLNFAEITAVTLGGSVTPATTTALATGGTSVTNIRDLNVVVERNLDDGGFTAGGAGKRVRSPALGMGAISGRVTAEFDSTTLRDSYLAQDDLPLTVTVVGVNTIGSGSDKPSLQLHLPNIRLEGDLPDAGPDVPTQSIDFTAFDNLSVAPITVSWVSTDTAP